MDRSAVETVRRTRDRLVSSVLRRCRYDLPGLWVALVLALLSFTPSLLPRPPEFQGFLVGVNAAIGYGIGVIGAWMWREFADRTRLPSRALSWRILAGTSVAAGLLAIVVGERWQRELRDLVGVAEVSWWRLLLIVPIAAVVFVLLVAIGRTFRAAYRRLASRLQRRMGDRAARALGLVVLVLGTALIFSGVLWDAAIRLADQTYALNDLTTPSEIDQPTSELRSGGPGSLLDWDTMGREGRIFAASGPDAASITDFSGQPAQEPIRTYAGLASAATTEARAELAVDDLERAGGFERTNLLVVTTTGTGWVEPSSVASFEYLTGGDSATVSMQYSHLPSWLSFLVDQSRARDAGRQLFDAVYERWSALPAGDRPRLYVFGESLGSFGGETAFSGESDLRNRIDGALFVGPPNFNPMYREFVDQRDAGSPEVEPIFRDGRTIRFTNRPRDSIPPDTPWPGTRVLYMQHPSDPVTWWSPDLILHRPDWLEEPRGRDILPEMRWAPFVTFWQVTADLPLSFTMPPEHGHTFTGEHVDGWAAVLQPPGWTAQQASRLRAIIRNGT
ncbi:alpha/beta hydrolase [Nocardioides sp.]|uniref:alpha/beta hydrolase n=1 Tax=Nocardioides sp. TaxID=35761 RepID=UPI003D0FCA4C